MSELLADSDNGALALVSAGLADERGQLEYVELWELGPDTEPHKLTQQLAEAVDALRPVVNLAGWRWLRPRMPCRKETWRGSDVFCFQSPAALRAVSALFSQVHVGKFRGARCGVYTALADAVISDMWMYRLPRWQQQVLPQHLAQQRWVFCRCSMTPSGRGAAEP